MPIDILNNSIHMCDMVFPIEINMTKEVFSVTIQNYSSSLKTSG